MGLGFALGVGLGLRLGLGFGFGVGVRFGDRVGIGVEGWIQGGERAYEAEDRGGGADGEDLGEEDDGYHRAEDPREHVQAANAPRAEAALERHLGWPQAAGSGTLGSATGAAGRAAPLRPPRGETRRHPELSGWAARAISGGVGCRDPHGQFERDRWIEGAL